MNTFFGMWSSSRLWLLLFLLLLPLFVFSSENPTEWPIMYNMGHTAFSTTEKLRPPLKLRWTARVPDAVRAGMSVAESCAVVKTLNGYLLCYNANTGALKWRTFVNSVNAHYRGAGETGVCIWNQSVYAAFHSAGHPYITGMRCYRLSDGVLLWKKPVGYTDARIRYSPQISGSRLYFCSNRDIAGKQSEMSSDWIYRPQVQCWNALTGDTLWTYTLDSNVCVNTTLLVVGDTIFASACNSSGLGVIVALDSAGNMLWSNKQYRIAPDAGNLQYFNGRLLVPFKGGAAGYVQLNASNGTLILADAGGYYYGKAAALMGGRYYSRGYGTFAIPFDLLTGVSQTFRISPPSSGAASGCGAPTAANGFIYNVFGSPSTSPDNRGHQILATDEMGNIVWYYQASGNHCPTLAIAYDRLYAVTETDGLVYCFENQE